MLAAVIGGALIVSSGGRARAGAEDGDRSAVAEALFQEGRALLMAGNAADACPKLEESQRLDPAAGTLMALALCREQVGELASAWAAFVETEGRARLDGRSDRERLAHDHATALRPRLSTVSLRVPSDLAGTPGLSIVLDGAALGAGAWNVDIPIDGGRPRPVIGSAYQGGSSSTGGAAPARRPAPQPAPERRPQADLDDLEIPTFIRRQMD